VKQKDLCNKIGIADRSFRRLSPVKRRQWLVLAHNGRTAAFYDVLAQLCFEVEYFNAANGLEWMWLQIDSGGVKLSRFHLMSDVTISHWVCATDEKLTQALQYVQSLNK